MLHEQQKDALAIVHDDLAAVQSLLLHSPSCQWPPLSTGQPAKGNHADVSTFSHEGSSGEQSCEASSQVEETVYIIVDHVFTKIQNCPIIPREVCQGAFGFTYST